MEVLWFVGFIVIVIGLFAFSYFVKRDASFEGDVVDKEVRSQMDHNDGFSTDFHYLKIKTTTGTIKSWQVKKSEYDSTVIGDHVVKVKGQSHLTITSKTAPPSAPIDAPKV